MVISPHAVDTQNPSAVAEAVKGAFDLIGEAASFPLLERLFGDVTSIFEGRYPGFQAIDMEYHDFDHTLQVTVCLTHLLQGRSRTTDEPILSVRDWELAVISALLHDTGFLKVTGDNAGTGAKYTFIHERRSCNFAREYLWTLEISKAEIEDICSAMMCTGPRNNINKVTFRREEARQIAQILVTADYLAQMSASDYLEKLPRLFLEFQEAFDTDNVPLKDRPYQSLQEMLKMTPNFWHGYVLPLLEKEAGGKYRYLSDGGKSNPYFRAVETNLEMLKHQLKIAKS